MDVFDLRDTLVADYRRFARSFTTIKADDIRDQVEAEYQTQRVHIAAVHGGGGS